MRQHLWIAIALLPLTLLTLYAVVSDVTGSSSLNACRMTYMYPDYLHVPIESKLSKYKLYLYQEGYGRKNSHIEVPVLFIPGNAGAFKQARSMGTLGNAYANEHFGLRVFTIDSINELAAFDSHLIREQAYFVNDAIKKILDSYTGPSYKPKSVILVAHSMGGIVAKSLFTMPNYINGSVNSIITLATPHAHPPVAIEQNMVDLYTSLNKFWASQYDGSQITGQHLDFNSLMLLSIAGGERDAMIQSSFCDVSGIVPIDHGFTIFSTGVRDVWVSADHRCILWCNQLTHVLVRGLYGMIDAETPERVLPVSTRVSSWRNLVGYGPANLNVAIGERPQGIQKNLKFVQTHSSRFVLTQRDPNTNFHVFPLGTTGSVNVFSTATFEIYACPSKSPTVTSFDECVSIRHLFERLPNAKPSKADGSVDVIAEVAMIPASALKASKSLVFRVSQFTGSDSVFGIETADDGPVVVDFSLKDFLTGIQYPLLVRSLNTLVQQKRTLESIFAYTLDTKAICLNSDKTENPVPNRPHSPIIRLATTSAESKILFEWPERTYPIRFHKDSNWTMNLFVHPSDLDLCGREGQELAYTMKFGIDLVASLGNIARRNVNLLIVFSATIVMACFVTTVLNGEDAVATSLVLPRVFATGVVAISLRLVLLAVMNWTEDSWLTHVVSSTLAYSIAYLVVLVVNLIVLLLEWIWTASLKIVPGSIRSR
ncbi:UNVERIFIED_CONTAM: GPI inositol deacylase [Siphonaria sp. JEL0065]|nr:GPI inositol deacylase [Siphonaria sp. JEL0065]